MSVDQSDRQVQPTKHRSGVRPGVRALVVAALLPIVPVVLALAIAISTNNLDAAYGLGISDELFNGLIVGVAAAVVGAVAASIWRLGGLRGFLTAAGASLAGVATYLSFLQFGLPDPPTSDWLALSIIYTTEGLAIWLGLRFAGLSLLGGLVVLVAAAVGVGGFVATRPEPPARVELILLDFTTEGTDGCRGSGALEGVGPGSRVIISQPSDVVGGEATEIGSATLPVGTVEDGGCSFEIGDPLGRPARDYGDVMFQLESDPDVASAGSWEGDRIAITFGVE